MCLGYLTRKRKRKLLSIPIERDPNNIFQDSNPSYQEVSEKIRKVTYNTDFFDKFNFEMRKGHAFHFNSGRIGKFIECEFEQPLKICKSKMVSESEANVTFVI